MFYSTIWRTTHWLFFAVVITLLSLALGVIFLWTAGQFALAKRAMTALVESQIRIWMRWMAETLGFITRRILEVRVVICFHIYIKSARGVDLFELFLRLCSDEAENVVAIDLQYCSRVNGLYLPTSWQRSWRQKQTQKYHDDITAGLRRSLCVATCSSGDLSRLL